jgi:hypothetical protein
MSANSAISGPTWTTLPVPHKLRAQKRIVVWPLTLKTYAILHGTWFALYAFLGKGFAYAGWTPFYVSELLFVLAVPALLATRRVMSLARTPIGAILGCFIVWQLICAAPQLDVYGVDTLRDSVIWAYALFALVVAAMVIRLPASVEILVQRYRRFASIYLFLGPVAWLATLYLRDWLPTWPGTSASIPLLKGDEYGVHLAGVFAFSMLGFGGGRAWWALVVLADAMMGMSVRSGLVAFISAAVFVLALRPKVGRLVLTAAAISMLVLTMAAFDLRFTPPGATRELSVDLLSRSLMSLVSDTERSDLESTKGWRLNWWRAIWSYTVDGPYFWTGKGYGVNLADSDGFQVGTRDEPLRSPHSSHLTFLARAGVPGFLLWVILQAAWGISLLRSYLLARRSQLLFWSGLFAWYLSYWIAFMVAAGFDVFLEGPMAGIPFWTVFGLGWGSHVLFRGRLAQPTNSWA